MEPANIDWKNIDSKFVHDDLYEYLNAPKWIDFSAPEESVDDEAWFCKPDCRHPKTAEDFLRSSPASKVKNLRSTSISEILPLGDRNRRDANLKRRGLISSSNPSNYDPKSDKLPTPKPLRKFHEDCENENPNMSTPPPKNHQSKILKAAIKSSAEKKKPSENSPPDTFENDRKPQLKSTFSARNLFAGREILNQVTEFCNELKKLAMRAKERENLEKSNAKKKKTPIAAKNSESSDRISGDSDEREKENQPSIEAEQVNSEARKSILKEKQRIKKRNEDETENIQITVDLKNVKRGEEESLLQVRTCPPSPQCFSATRGPQCTSKTTITSPFKPSSKHRPAMERGILQEVMEQNNKKQEEEEEEAECKDSNSRRSVTSIAGTGTGTEGVRSLDMFWFLKPCTFANQ